MAWAGRPNAFLAVLGFSLLTDFVDGRLARRLDPVTERGAELDSWGDLATYLVIPLGAW